MATPERVSKRVSSNRNSRRNNFTTMSDSVSVAMRFRIMAAIKSKDTSPKTIVRRLVHSPGYRYRLHGKTPPGKPDLVFSTRHKVIELRGCFWHMHSCGRCRIPTSRRAYWTAKIVPNAARDKYNQQSLRRAGWSVLVVWECPALSENTAIGRCNFHN